MRYKTIYCVYCGEKNTVKDTKCRKCDKKLDPKENMFLDYIKDHIKGDIKGNVQDSVISIIKNFIISHLYGSILTATLIFTLVSAVVTNVQEKDDVIEVTEKPTVLVNNLNKCVIENSSELVNICSDGYVLDGDKCKKEEQVDATINNVCPNGYYASGNTCISNINYNILTRQECITPSEAIGSRVEEGVCWADYCAGWTDGECSAGYMEPIDFTTISYCPDGTSMVNGVCKSFANYYVEYSCNEGQLSDNKCIITREEEPTLGCAEGYILNQECNLCILGE